MEMQNFLKNQRFVTWNSNSLELEKSSKRIVLLEVHEIKLTVNRHLPFTHLNTVSIYVQECTPNSCPSLPRFILNLFSQQQKLIPCYALDFRKQCPTSTEENKKLKASIQECQAAFQSVLITQLKHEHNMQHSVVHQ